LADHEAELAHAIEQMINWGIHAKRLLEKVSNPPPPWEEESSVELDAVQAPKPGQASLKPEAAVKALNEVYPHGWTDNGNKRPPGLKKALAQLRAKQRKGWSLQVIVDGAKRFAEAVGGTEDQRYSPQLWRWVRDELWLEVPEPILPKRKSKSPEQIEAERQQAATAAQRRLQEQIRKAGLVVDEDGNVVG